MPRRDRAPARTGLLVALGAAAGLAAGAVVGGTAAPPPAPPPPAATQPALPPAVSCVRAAELAEEVVDLAEEASRAMADLDARRMEEVLELMRDRDTELRQESRRCRATESS